MEPAPPRDTEWGAVPDDSKLVHDCQSEALTKAMTISDSAWLSLHDNIGGEERVGGPAQPEVHRLPGVESAGAEARRQDGFGRISIRLMSHPDPNGPPDLTPIQIGEVQENPVTGGRTTILDLPWKNPEGRMSAELIALVGARVVGEHRHPARVRRALSSRTCGTTGGTPPTGTPGCG
jgi:hypothetical protein